MDRQIWQRGRFLMKEDCPQNGNALPANQMRNLVGGVATATGIGVGRVPQLHNMINVVDPELLGARGYLCDKIFAVLLCHQQTIDDSQRTGFRDISKRLEECLFKAALTKDFQMDISNHLPIFQLVLVETCRQLQVKFLT